MGRQDRFRVTFSQGPSLGSASSTVNTHKDVLTATLTVNGSAISGCFLGSIRAPETILEISDARAGKANQFALIQPFLFLPLVMGALV
jgi:hypothetical protein